MVYQHLSAPFANPLLTHAQLSSQIILPGLLIQGARLVDLTLNSAWVPVTHSFRTG